MYPFFYYIIFVLLLFTNTKAVAQRASPKVYDNYINQERQKTDSLIQLRELLTAKLEVANMQKDSTESAILYQKKGVLDNLMYNYKSAEENFLEAYHIYNAQDKNKEIDVVLHQLLSTYTEGSDKKRFDSIYPIAINYSRKLKSRSLFLNYSSKINISYQFVFYDTLLNVTEKALNDLKDKPLHTLKTTEHAIFNFSEKEMFYKYKLFNAFSYFKLNFKNKNDESNFNPYSRFLAIDSDSLAKYLKRDSEYNKNVSLLNYYKSVYYKEIGDFESAYKHIYVSDSYKFRAITQYEKENAVVSDNIYKVIKAEEELKKTKELLIKDNILDEVYKIMFISLIILVFVLLGFLIYYFQNRRKIKGINDELTISNNSLQLKDEERLQFISKLSHELRTPIYSINGLATLIKKEKDETKKKNYLSSLTLSTKYMSMLIDNVLQEKRFTFEKDALNLLPNNISEQFNNIYTTAAPLCKNRKVNVVLKDNKLHKDEFLMVDRIALNQIVLNLIYNAVKFSNKDDTVQLIINESKRTKNKVTLIFEVIDEGKGFKYNTNASTTFTAYDSLQKINENPDETGLGLEIVQKLLKEYNSKLFFKTEINKGTHFKFSIVFDKAIDAIDYTNLLKDTIPNETIQVLAVDDVKLNLLITKKCVEELENTFCSTAQSGEAAIAAIKKKDFDLVLMDINMPEMDGFEATTIIKEIKPNLTIIALTALNLQDVNIKAKQVGMIDIITKPYDKAEFHKIILNHTRTKDAT